MKKKFKIFFIIEAVIFYLCCMFALSLYGIISASQITEEHFVEYIESKGCTIIDRSSDDKDIEIYYETDNCPYHINYLIISNNEIRRNIYQEIKEKVEDNENRKDGDGLQYSGINYAEVYTIGDYYKVVSMYKDSILFIETDIALKDEVVEIKRDFGYYIENKSNLYILFLIFGIVDLMLIYITYSNWKKIKKQQVNE